MSIALSAVKSLDDAAVSAMVVAGWWSRLKAEEPIRGVRVKSPCCHERFHGDLLDRQSLHIWLVLGLELTMRFRQRLARRMTIPRSVDPQKSILLHPDPPEPHFDSSKLPPSITDVNFESPYRKFRRIIFLLSSY